jgi:hypothetical protein
VFIVVNIYLILASHKISPRLVSKSVYLFLFTMSSSVPQGAILAMCNPLLDISAEVPTELFEKCVLSAIKYVFNYFYLLYVV